MMPSQKMVSERLQTWAQNNPTSITPERLAIREDFLERFPLERLPQLTLDEYVIGHGDQDNFCYWLERRTGELGSIFGGAAKKFGVYWSEEKSDYRFSAMFSSPEDAKQRILNGIVQGAAALRHGNIREMDQATAQAMGEDRYTMRLKPLSLYFPEQLLPIFNPEHLKHFLRTLGEEPSGDQGALNVQLLSALRLLPGIERYDTQGMMRFLYSEFPPPAVQRQVWKIALGEQSRYLREALEQGVILVGSSLADLSAYEPAQMATALEAAGQSGGFDDTATAFAHRMQAGDVVVVNRGMSEILAIGVIEGPYLAPASEGNPLTLAVLGDRFPFWAHARQVRWLLRTPLALPAGLRKLAQKTITRLPDTSLTAILKGYASQNPTAETLAALKELGMNSISPVTPVIPQDIAELLEIAESTRNIILYGPPGTGKTFTARRFAEALLRSQVGESVTRPSSQANTWWQAAALALTELGSAKIREIEAHPAVKSLLTGKNNSNVYQTLWQQLMAYSQPDEATDAAPTAGPYYFTRTDSAQWSLTAEGERATAQLRDTMTGVDEDVADPLGRFLQLVTFHPAFTYEEFIEGLRPTADGRGLIVRDGVFKRVCTAARKDPENRYVIIIDEINRADTAKTFGELITLIEDDKRAQPGEVVRYEAQLPYSDPPFNRFSVPENVFLIGTMNTADRSVALMDLALRRRFTFVEVPPITTHLGTVEGLPLGKLLHALNVRLTAALDRDHAIGHAYLIAEQDALTARALRFRWRHKILPLLQEYFYADEERLRELLGEVLYRDATQAARLADQDFIPALKTFAEVP